MSKRKCPYLNYEWCWGEDGEEFKEKICPIESHYKGGLIGCFYSTDYKDCITYNLQQEIERLNNIIFKIEQYLIDCGVDDEILKLCGIYDVNGVELRKYIEELKEGK